MTQSTIRARRFYAAIVTAVVVIIVAVVASFLLGGRGGQMPGSTATLAVAEEWTVAQAVTPIPTLEEARATKPSEQESDDRLEERMEMVERQIRRRGVTDQDVLDAMERVPRHEFVPDQHRSQAYADHPLPIGYGQTISQPYIVALMTELLALSSTDRVLEIGTGSGYQAAILGEIVDEVYTVEIVEPLAIEAKSRLQRLGYENVHVRHADGYYGWEEHAPYDAIIVTCAPDHIPLPLVQQLRDGGKLVIPVGPPGGYQTLWEVVRQGEEIKKRNVTGVAFVPLTGEHPVSP
jgi:protein-L-isoaspartate(D-aspartate) O-methyltransferase